MSLQGNKCTLVIYMSIIVVLLGLMIAAIVVDVESRDLGYLRDAMNYSLTNYEPGLSQEWDDIQRNVRDQASTRRGKLTHYDWIPIRRLVAGSTAPPTGAT